VRAKVFELALDVRYVVTYPEKLLTRRYALQSDLWGLSQELALLQRQSQLLLDELESIKADGGVTKQKRRERLHLDLRPINERSRLLREVQVTKRDELIRVETQLRETFRAMGHAIAIGDQQVLADAERLNGAKSLKIAEDSYDYDLFVSHAFEDKEDVVRPLVKCLRELGIKVWYDEVELTVGDSLRQSIDRGLITSRFGIVVISPFFLRKRWTIYELDSLVAREVESGKVILPIWHKVTKDEVLHYSPKLADKRALNTATDTISDIALEVAIAIYNRPH
jgi:NADPH-dependent 7-cyano-7-deazaguanine reductase QueF-like protein